MHDVLIVKFVFVGKGNKAKKIYIRDEEKGEEQISCIRIPFQVIYSEGKASRLCVSGLWALLNYRWMFLITAHKWSNTARSERFSPPSSVLQGRAALVPPRPGGLPVCLCMCVYVM